MNLLNILDLNYEYVSSKLLGKVIIDITPISLGLNIVIINQEGDIENILIPNGYQSTPINLPSYAFSKVSGVIASLDHKKSEQLLDIQFEGIDKITLHCPIIHNNKNTIKYCELKSLCGKLLTRDNFSITMEEITKEYNNSRKVPFEKYYFAHAKELDEILEAGSFLRGSFSVFETSDRNDYVVLIVHMKTKAGKLTSTQLILKKKG